MNRLSSFGFLCSVLFLLFAPDGVSFAQDISYSTIDSSYVEGARNRTYRGTSTLYDMKDVGRIVSVAGIPDVLRRASTLPGVTQGMEGTLGMFVRGSSIGGSQVRLNGVPVQSSAHLMGLYSIFDPNMIEDARFYSGGINPAFGNLSSSLTDIRMKSGEVTRPETSWTFSPYMIGVSNSFKVFGDKVNARTSVRISPSFLLLKGAYQIDAIKNLFGNISNVGGYSYDLSAHLDWKAGGNGKFEIVVLATGDNIEYTFKTVDRGLDNMAQLFKVGYSSVIGNGIDIDVSLYATNDGNGATQTYYLYRTSRKKTLLYPLISQKEDYTKVSNQTYGARFQARKTMGKHLSMEGGLEYVRQAFNPRVGGSLRRLIIDDSAIGNSYLNLLSLFGEARFRPSQRVDIVAGFRPTLNLFHGGGRFNFDAHILSDILFTDSIGMEVSLDRMVQYSHHLEGMPTGWSNDLVVASERLFPEEVTHQAYLGLFLDKEIGGGNLSATLGAYYRNMDNILSYKSARNVFGVQSTSWKENVELGKGSSRGVELGVNYKGRLLSVDLAYTLSKTDRTFPTVNKGETFRFRFDRPHNLSLGANLITHRGIKGSSQRLGVSGTFSSGNLMTAPLSSYEGAWIPYFDPRYIEIVYPDDDVPYRGDFIRKNPALGDEFWKLIFNRTEGGTNMFRLPYYFRMDASYTFEFKTGKRNNELSLSVYNLTNRHNPYQYFEEDSKWKQLSIFPIMPSVRWSMSW